MIALRRAHPVFRRQGFFQGRPIHGSEVKDIAWLKPDGTEMTDQEWEHEFARSLGVYLAGEALAEVDVRGQPVKDQNLLVLFNAHHETVEFRLPAHAGPGRWFALLDTAHEHGLASNGTFDAGATYPLQGRSLALMVHSRSAT
jgi:glycogen operon protein